MQKLNNAPKQQQKEKYEQEMKKEIKKLQKVREQLKVYMNNSEVKDKSKLAEQKRRIENVLSLFLITIDNGGIPRAWEAIQKEGVLK